MTVHMSALIISTETGRYKVSHESPGTGNILAQLPPPNSVELLSHVLVQPGESKQDENELVKDRG